MKANPFEQSREQQPFLSTEFTLMDFRAGHWPGAKTPPWLLNESWANNNDDWQKAAQNVDWRGQDEVKIGVGMLNNENEFDVYARKNNRPGLGFDLLAYPKGKSYADFWDSEGNEIIDEDEE